MAIFGALATSSSGLHVYRTWLDAISDNLSNMNDVAPTSGKAFQERFVVATSAGTDIGAGARVAGVQFGSGEGRLVSDPTNPIADANGLVRYPDVDLGSQMTQLLMAQRGYEANLAVVDRVREAYSQALTIGR
jgi:flagellar basal-body rod protein FlgC